MVRFYFEMRDGDGVIPDIEGEEFKNLTEARTEAEAVLRELVADDIAAARPLQPRSCAIHDGDGQLLVVVRLLAVLEKEERSAGAKDSPQTSPED
jgi:hypothetical protein